MSGIEPIHHSVQNARRSVYNRTPRKMVTQALPNDLKNQLSKIAISIFEDSVNAGATFQDAILACYLSGLDHGVNGGSK